MQSSISKTNFLSNCMFGINKKENNNINQNYSFNINSVSKADTFEKSSVAHNKVAHSGKSFRRIENVVFSSNEIFPVGYKKVSIMPKPKIAFTGKNEKPEKDSTVDDDDCIDDDDDDDYGDYSGGDGDYSAGEIANDILYNSGSDF